MRGRTAVSLPFALQRTVKAVLAVCIAAVGISDAGYGQTVEDTVWSIDLGRVRVVFPTAELRDTAQARAIEQVVSTELPIRGIDPGVLNGKLITVSLTAGAGSGRMPRPRAVPSLTLIILPLDRLSGWSGNELRRILAHELAHVSLGWSLGFRELPIWVEEGFAEWAAGGLTCAGEARVRMQLATQERRAAEIPGLRRLSSAERSRGSYDFFATLIEYIDLTWRGIVADGRFVAALKVHGALPALSELLGLELEELERDWHRYLLKKYGSLPPEFSCG